MTIKECDNILFDIQRTADKIGFEIDTNDNYITVCDIVTFADFENRNLTKEEARIFFNLIEKIKNDYWQIIKHMITSNQLNKRSCKKCIE